MSAKCKVLGHCAVLVVAAGMGWLGHDSGSSARSMVKASAYPAPASMTSVSAEPVVPAPIAAASSVSSTVPLAITVNVQEDVEAAEAAQPSMEEAGFDSQRVYSHSNRLQADWRRYDRARLSASRWGSWLNQNVDPMFTQTDGWHFYNPDTLDGIHDSVRRQPLFTLNGGIKFSRSF